MNRSSPSLSRLLLVCILTLCSCLISAAAETPNAISLRETSLPSLTGGGGNSLAPEMTPDGRFVLFSSTAGNLAATGTGEAFARVGPTVLNVYIRDRLAARTWLASAAIGQKTCGNSDSIPGGLSTNGSLAVFESRASNLVSGDTNASADVFVYDILADETVLASAATNGICGDMASYKPVMTPGGNFVAFASKARNLAANDTNGKADIFLRDLQADSTRWVSVEVPPVPATYTNLGCDLPQISAAGNRIAFAVNAKNRFSGVSTRSICVFDASSGATTWGSSGARTALGLTGDSEVICFGHVISEDGSCVAYQAISTGSGVMPSAVLRYNFTTGATDLIHTNAHVGTLFRDDIQNVNMSADGRFVAFLAKTNTNTCVIVWDANTGLSTLASVNLSNQVSETGTCQSVRLDRQGRWVAFMSSATDLVTNAVSSDYHLYLRDLQAQTTSLLDSPTNDLQWNLTGVTIPALSDDARYVAWESVRPGGASHENTDIYVLDRQAGTWEIASVPATSLETATAGGLSRPGLLTVSSNGQFVAFSSLAEDLVPNDHNLREDVFVRSVAGGTNILSSQSLEGLSGNAASFEPLLSADGRCVAFSSIATNLVASDSNRAQDVFIRDLENSVVSLVSATYNGVPANSNSSPAAISQNGRYVLFRSQASNLVPISSASGDNLFLRDMLNQTNISIPTNSFFSATLDAQDMTPDAMKVVYSRREFGFVWYVSVWDLETRKVTWSNSLPNLSWQVAIAPNGSRVAWLSNNAGVYSTIVQALPSNSPPAVVAQSSSKNVRFKFSADGQWFGHSAIQDGKIQLYLYDCIHGTNVLVSHNTVGAAASGDSDSPALSPDGRFVAYHSSATDIVANDTNSVPDLFLFDRVSGSTLLLSHNGDGSANGPSKSPCFSPDGKVLAFLSWASNMHPRDFNETGDIFTYSLFPSETSFYVQATIAGGFPRLLWPASPGKTYQVEYKDDLSGEWHLAEGSVVITGSQGSYIDSGLAQCRFFRIVEE